MSSKPPSSVSSSRPRSGCSLIAAYSSSSSGPGFWRIDVGDRELADVVQEPADREAAQADGGEAELLADLDRERGDAARVLLGRGVLGCEPHHERAHACAEVRLLRGDDLRGAQIADERARPAAAAEVVDERCADDGDPDDLEDVTEPPAEVDEAEHQRAVERAREQHDADHDREVGTAAREQEGVHRAERERAVDAEPDGEQGDRRRASAATAHPGRGSARRAPTMLSDDDRRRRAPPARRSRAGSRARRRTAAAPTAPSRCRRREASPRRSPRSGRSGRRASRA